jgi:flagellar protein FliS
MATAGYTDYLANDVLSAPPQKLQLLLIEGAIRNVLLTKKHWQDGQDNLALETLVTAQDILAQLVGGVKANASPTAGKAQAVYAFIHRTLIEAGLAKNPATLSDAERVLRIELETWRQVCQQLGQSEPLELSERMSLEA